MTKFYSASSLLLLLLLCCFVGHVCRCCNSYFILN
ncbi:hypothetical protein BVRB_5g104340 [Beta vulgaris subsp. vulgaris]|nr:hypothetical protein BVRB_5g104340 [Beta vulgaris subsp. vulgaris]